MRKFKLSLFVMVVLGAVFGTGCNDMHQTFHERAGIMIAGIDPQVLSPAFSGTNEADLISTGTFPETTVTFANLNAIQGVIKAFKVDYYEIGTGLKKGALTSSGTTYLPVGPVSATGSSTTSTSSTTPASTPTTCVPGSVGLTINPWTQAVKVEMYGNTTTRTDNKSLEARIDIYGEDYNGNTFVISAAVTLMP